MVIADQVVCRGIRGATTVDADTPAAVGEAVVEMLTSITEANAVDVADIAAVTFTIDDDLTVNPATAARLAGWTQVPLLAVHEHAGATIIDRCIRVLVLVNTRLSQSEIRHVYLRGARQLRPDLAVSHSSEEIES